MVGARGLQLLVTFLYPPLAPTSYFGYTAHLLGLLPIRLTSLYSH
jgi:hypothetical protein